MSVQFITNGEDFVCESAWIIWRFYILYPSSALLHLKSSLGKGMEWREQLSFITIFCLVLAIWWALRKRVVGSSFHSLYWKAIWVPPEVNKLMIQYNKGIRESRLDHYLLTVNSTQTRLLQFLHSIAFPISIFYTSGKCYQENAGSEIVFHS